MRVNEQDIFFKIWEIMIAGSILYKSRSKSLEQLIPFELKHHRKFKRNWTRYLQICSLGWSIKVIWMRSKPWHFHILSWTRLNQSKNIKTFSYLILSILFSQMTQRADQIQNTTSTMYLIIESVSLMNDKES
jgi:hypothetical protein